MDPETRKKLPRIFFFLAAIILLVKVVRDNNEAVVLNQVTGQTMGSIPYVIKYRTRGEIDYKDQIDSTLVAFNQSLSTYIPDSEISRFNSNDTLVYVSELFYPVLNKSREVFTKTSGSFDPTIGPLVNAWGFGPMGRKEDLDTSDVSQLLNFVGFDKVVFNSEYAVKSSGMYLDFSAIAKGYAIDCIAKFLESKDVGHYMIEIGGEVRTKGTNDKDRIWSIGIEDPLVEMNEQKLMAIVQLDSRSVATSGNYRNYYEVDGQLFAHIIDPRTGFTTNRNILSASVFAPDCMTADAYATAFMVLGVEGSLEICQQDPTLDALLIFRNEEGKIENIMTDGIAKSVMMQ